MSHKKITIFTLVALALAVTIMTMFSYVRLEAAAVAVTSVSGVEVTVDSNGSISESNGTVTVTAQGSFSSSKTATVTVKNTSGSTANISFDYSGTQVGGCSLGGVSSNKCSGTKTVLLTAGSTTTFTITSRTWNSNTTVTMKLSNFKVEAVAAESDVTVTYGSLGSVKIDDTTVASGSVNAVSSATGASFVAVPGSGSKFVAWINPATNAVISTSATYQLIPTEAMSIKAIFANASAAPVFYADGTAKLFESWDAALNYVSSASNKVITLASDGTLPAGNYNIPSGVTLLIPRDVDNTLYTTKPAADGNGSYTKPTVYRQLTMASGAHITVEGALSVAGQHQTSQTYGYNGVTNGPTGYIKMESNSTITIKNKANLYAWGYIYGSGSVTVENGGTVYESFQVRDYRGGDATTSITKKKDTWHLFPMMQYYVQNVEVPMTLNAGAIEKGVLSVFITLAGVQQPEIPFIGSDGMFNITNGYIVKDYDEATDRLVVTVHGDLTMQSYEFDFKVSLIGSININTADYILPLNHNISIDLQEGNLTINQDLGFLPGTELLIQDGAVCTVTNGAKIYLYDGQNWGKYCGEKMAGTDDDTTLKPLTYVAHSPQYNRWTEDLSKLPDATILVNGKLDATNGAIYTTEAGANIYSTANGQVIQGTTDAADMTTYQVTQDSTAVTEITIAFTSAKLKNGNGTYSETTGANNTTYVYCSTHSVWYTGECASCTPACTHTNTTTQNYKAATCTAAGYSGDVVCSDCGETVTKGTTIAKVAHTIAQGAAQTKTCTQDGWTAYEYCTKCTYSTKVIIPAGHTLTQVAAQAPTCTEKGWDAYEYCTECTHTTYVEKAALGHTAGAAVEENRTESTCTVAGSYDEVVYCSVCKTHEISRTKKNLPLAEHTPGTIVVENIVKGTSTSKPQYDAVSYCTECGEEVRRETVELEQNVFAGMSMDLEYSLEVKFGVDTALLSGNNHYAVITRTYADGRESDTITREQTEWDVYSGTVYSFPYAGIDANEMIDRFNVIVYNETGEIVGVYTDSVQEYAMRQITSTSKPLGYRRMFVDMLNYSAEAQLRFTYATGNLANAELTEEHQAIATASVSGTNNQNKDDKFGGSSLMLENRIKLNFMFLKAGVTEDMYAEITYQTSDGRNKTIRYTSGDFKHYSNTYWFITVDGMSITDGYQIVTCTLYNADGTVYGVMEDSMESYLARNLEKDSLYPAILKFIDSASKWFS